MVNMEQLFMCTKIGQALSKSSTPNNCESICDGARGYIYNDTEHKVEQVSNLNKYQGPQCSHKVFKSNKCRSIFYQRTGLYMSIHMGEQTYNCSEYDNVSFFSFFFEILKF